MASTFPKGRALALDYGDVRIGFAYTDFHRILSTPAPFISNNEVLKQSLIEIQSEYEPVFWIVGNPLNLSGHESESTEKVNSFLQLLSSITHVPIFLVDERRSTLEASRKLHEAGVSSLGQKTLIDSMVAVSFLELAIEQENKNGQINLTSFSSDVPHEN